MKDTTTTNKTVIEQLKEDSPEHGCTELKSTIDERGTPMNKLIISLPLLLVAALLSAAASTTTTVAYGQDWFLGSPDDTVVQQTNPPNEQATATTPSPQQPQNMTEYCAPEYVICEGEPIPPSRAAATATTNTTTTTTRLAQDPEFVRFGEVGEQCVNSAAFGSSGATMTQEQCTQFFEQAQEKWCGLAAYDAEKCEHASRISAAWNNLVNLSEAYGFSDIPSIGELGIDPRTIAPPSAP